MEGTVAGGGKTFFGHPRGLATLFFTEMWERFSYYGMRALLVLFMVDQINNGGLGFDEGKASAIYGLYTSMVYLLALAGGWVADKMIGQRKAVWYGGIIIAAGHFSMAVPMISTFYFGLVLIVIGTGLLKPNVSTIVGDLYPEGGARRDAGFSIFYMGINLGAFIGPLLCGYLGENIDWHLGFSLAGIGMVFGLIQFKMTEGYLGEAGIEPKAKEAGELAHDHGSIMGATIIAVIIAGILGAVAATGLITIDLTTMVGFVEATGYIILALATWYFAYLLFAGGFDVDEKKRIVVIAFLFVGAAIFWSGFEQAGTSLNLFGKYFTDRVMFDWEMPASWLQSINAIFIIILAPFFGWLWIWLAKRHLEPSSPIKFAFGLVFLGLGFGVMFLAAKLAVDQGKVGVTFLTLTYLLHTIGELCLSPVGLSTMTKLAPKRIVGQTMGIWFLATSLGNLIAGLVAGRFNFTEFNRADSAMGSLGDSLTDEYLAGVDPNILEKIDPTIIANKDVEAYRSSLQAILDAASQEGVAVMPGMFWFITSTIVGAGIIFFVIAVPMRKLLPKDN
ncbi:MAG: peptide MFS transporter [Acidobacteriota bacterium]|nr:peptide MFS transporter [Acidobacteriota bacterium]